MKRTILALSLTIVTLGAVMNSCQTSSEKMEQAKEKVQDAKDNLNDVKSDSINNAVKVANAEEWQAFKLASNKKIASNLLRIEEIKFQMKKAGHRNNQLLDLRIDSFQKRNEELTTRMYKYENGKTDWESFKAEFNHDMDGLGSALKNFTVNNK